MGSLKLTLVMMLLVAIWFTVGAILSVSSQYGNAFRLLNDILIGKALFGLPSVTTRVWSPLFRLDRIRDDMISSLPSPEVAVVGWMWVAFILAFLLGVNLIFGTRHWFFDIFKKRLDFRKFLLFAMHILFGVVLVGHLISAVSGFKAVGEFPIGKGQKMTFLEEYTLKVDGINIGSPHSNLQPAAAAM